MKVKDQAHWERKCKNLFSRISSSEVRRFTSYHDQNDHQPILHISSNTFHQRKMLPFVIIYTWTCTYLFFYDSTQSLWVKGQGYRTRSTCSFVTYIKPSTALCFNLLYLLFSEAYTLTDFVFASLSCPTTLNPSSTFLSSLTLFASCKMTK